MNNFDTNFTKKNFLIGIFLTSITTLGLEVCLTRYFSISQEYHFAFLVVSIAFLGYGASGSFLTLFEKTFIKNPRSFLPVLSIIYSFSIILSFLVGNRVPFNFIQLSWNSEKVFYIFVYYFIFSIPFFFAGLIISFSMSRNPENASRIYFADLGGAAAGTIIPLFIFLPRGDRGVFIFLSFFPLLASFFFSKRKIDRLKIIAIFCLGILLVILYISPEWLSFRISPFKALPAALKHPGAKILTTKWNAISRIDIIESPAVRFAPGLSLIYSGDLPSQLGLSIDGGELSALTSFTSVDDPALKFLHHLPSSLAYKLVSRPKVLLISPKAGLDLVSAVTHKAKKIKIIESNPLIVKLLKTEFADYSGSLYLQENIDLTLAQPRAGLNSIKKSFDLIVFSLTNVFGSSGSGLYGFGEDYLFTVEAFSAAFNRLSADGWVEMSFYLIPPPRQELRAVATWIKALENEGKAAPQHLMILRSWGTMSILVKKSPIKIRDIRILKEFCSQNFYDLVHYPGIAEEEVNRYNRFQEPTYFRNISSLFSKDRDKFFKNYLFNVKPASDDQPFFNNYFKINKIDETYRAFGNKWFPFLEGEGLVIVLLAQAFILSFLLILLPRFLLGRKKYSPKNKTVNIFCYFYLLGLSYMFIEITLIQKFILFLEHPVFSVSIIIAGLLISSGIGSYLSKKILSYNIKKKLKKVLYFVGITAVAYSFLISLFIDLFIETSIWFKAVIGLIFIFPLGLLMGIPFPSGIRLLQKSPPAVISWGWAANAFSSVINSILALVMAFWIGYSAVWLVGAFGYLFASLFLNFSYHGNKTNS